MSSCTCSSASPRTDGLRTSIKSSCGITPAICEVGAKQTNKRRTVDRRCVSSTCRLCRAPNTESQERAMCEMFV
jgi:hypothetical protein